MKRSTGVTVALALLIWICPALAENETTDPTGTWKWKLVNQTAENTVKLKLEGDKLAGALLRRDKEVPIEEATYKDGMVSFKVIVISQQGCGRKFMQEYRGTISGDTITGTIEFTHPNQTITRNWNANRVPN